MTLAAFSQIQSLIATLNEHIRITPHAEMCAVAVSVKDPPATMLGGSGLCDDCHQQGQQATTPGKMKAQQQQQKAKHQIVLHEDEDGYCELVEVTGRDRRRRSSSINKAAVEGSSAEVAGVTLNGESSSEQSSTVLAEEEVPVTEEAVVQSTPDESLDREEEKEGNGDEEEEEQQQQLLLSMAGGESYYRSAMRLKEQLLSSTQTVPLSLIAANVLALNQTITKLLVSRGRK